MSVSEIRRLLAEYRAELNRIGQINTDEDRERVVPELMVWTWMNALDQAARQDGWQPIKTAPQDGDWPVLLFIPGYGVNIGCWLTMVQAWSYSDDVEDPPTHWMPLPEPPCEICDEIDKLIESSPDGVHALVSVDPRRVERYRVERCENDEGDFHILTFADGRELYIFTVHPVIDVEPEKH